MQTTRGHAHAQATRCPRGSGLGLGCFKPAENSLDGIGLRKAAEIHGLVEWEAREVDARGARELGEAGERVGVSHGALILLNPSLRLGPADDGHHAREKLERGGVVPVFVAAFTLGL